MKYFVIFIVILTGFFVISFDNAFACSCQPPKPPPEEFARADAVFMGTVINLDSYQGHITGAEFEVQKIWKGISTSSVHVSNWAGTSCEYDFVVNQTYVVYAYGSDSLSTHQCTRTTLLTNAYDDLRSLGVGTIPNEDSEKICLGINCPEQSETIQKTQDFQNLLVVVAIGIPTLGITIGFVVWNRNTRVKP
ncbi:MAG: hypothetical protein ABI337_01130 [Nitrososphaera sp.]